MQKSARFNQGMSTAAAAFPIVLSLSFAHFLNDMVQALLPAIYPIIKESYGLSFGQIGLLTLAFQLTASLFQPLVGVVTDRKPQPFSLAAGMAATLAGLVILASAASYSMLLIGAGLIGTGSAIFHPEATRMARLASGSRHGLAQSLFQVGGQAGSAAGPLLAAFIVVPAGQRSLVWFSGAVLLAMLVLFRIGRWYQAQMPVPAPRFSSKTVTGVAGSSSGVGFIIAVLFLLMFSKSAYTASLSNYYTFYVIDKFQVSVQTSQYLLFAFLLAQVVGSLVGGHLGDRFGRLGIIWFSILGALPFTLALPYANLALTIVFTVIIGLIMASAFPAILVYAIDLVPSRVGVIAGVFYGVSFGLGALSAAGLGELADHTSLKTVYLICSYLPLIGLCAWFLPRIAPAGARAGH
jgi:FSR family fosmidomycin resistance protein-like MFS transporter